MPFLIDGYNLYHAAIKFHEEWAGMTPHALCAMIALDITRLREVAIVVFDGAQPRGQSWAAEPMGPVQVVYCGGGKDADAMLEELIEKNTAPRRLTVVSSDRRLRRAAGRRRATALTAPEYLKAMVQRQNRPAPPPPEPPEKRRGVSSPGELEVWLKLFGLDPKAPTDDPNSRIKF